MDLIIIGGGISGLFMANLAQKINPSYNITIIERSNHIGGLLHGFHYPEGYYFDKGTHLFRESGIDAIDSFMTSQLEESTLFYLPDHAYSGCIFEENLQENSHYPYIKDSKERRSTIEHLVNSQREYEFSSLENYCYSAFGETYSKNTLFPIAEKIYRKSSDELSHYALKIIGQDRFLSNSHSEWEHVSFFNSLIAYPDQRKMPESLKNPRRRFYSKQKGTFSIVNGLAEKLRNNGVNILTDTEVLSINSHNIDIRENEKKRILAFDKLAFATNIFITSKILGAVTEKPNHDSPLEHYVANIILSQTPTSELAFFYNFDNPDSFFRVTNYSRIVNDDTDKRLSIEILKESNKPVSKKDIQQAISKLIEVNFIEDCTKTTFEKIEKLENGFPMMTNKNHQFASLVRDAILKKASNHFFLGRDDENLPFLQSDILHSIYRNLPRYL